MITVPEREQIHDLLTQMQMLLQGPDGVSAFDGDWIVGRALRLHHGAFETLMRTLGSDMEGRRADADRLQVLMLALYDNAPLRVSDLAPNRSRQLSATVAIAITNTIARAHGLTLLGVSTDEYLAALTNTYMADDERREAVRALCRSGEHALSITNRPRPDPADGPIVSLGTPISFVTRDQQLAALEVADALEDILDEQGMQADVPGRHIHPGVNYPDADLIERDKTARCALANASALIGIDAHLGRRGMGFAVSQMEDSGGPVLLMPREIESFVFARVFGSRLSHREENIYSDTDDAMAQTRTFLRDHRACLMARHGDILAARRTLARSVENLAGRLEVVDKALFLDGRMTQARASYLLTDPANLIGAQFWELRELARLLNVSYTRLVAVVGNVELNTLTPNARPVPAPPRDPRSGSRSGLGSAEYQAFRAAGQLLPEWDVNKAMELMDEYMEPVAAALTDARSKKRTDARDWVDAYLTKFGR